MNAEAGERTGSAPADAERSTAEVPVDAVLTAGVGLLTALRRFAVALLALFAAEVRVLGASVALVFLASVALVAFAVSLWACVVALIGWALTLATGSVGIALGILVVLHLILVTAIWFMIKRAIHHASFPQARAEFGALRHTLQRELTKIQRASATPSEQGPAP